MRVDTGGVPLWYSLALLLYLVVAFVVGVVAWFRWRGGLADQLDAGVAVTTFRGLQVSVVYQENEGRAVALNFGFTYGQDAFPSRQSGHVVMVTPTHARQLAEWLRIAAGKAPATR